MDYSLKCISWNPRHVKFSIFDHLGAKVGDVTVLTSDVLYFVGRVWNGALLWEGLLPKDAIEHPENYGHGR
jgi:hypothetical protein